MGEESLLFFFFFAVENVHVRFNFLYFNYVLSGIIIIFGLKRLEKKNTNDSMEIPAKKEEEWKT